MIHHLTIRIGKSSIVSAICVGLAGNTKLLGRASKVADYIKHGKTEAFTEIELYMKAPKKNITVTRTFKRTGDKETTSWKINGQKKTTEEVKTLMDKLNIKLDNLTQFLPQEKVCEFAALSPIDRLKQTQEAVLAPEVIEYQQRLIQQQEKFKKSTQVTETMEKNLQTLKTKNATLEKDVEKYHLRKKCLARAEICRMKLPVAKYRKNQQIGKEIKLKKDELEKTIAEHKRTTEPYRDEIDAYQTKINEVERKSKADKEKVNSLKSKFENITNKLENSATKIRNYHAEIAEAKRSAAQKKANLEKLDNQIKVIEEKLSKQDDTLETKINQKQQQKREADDRLYKDSEKRMEASNALSDKTREIEEVRAKLKKLESAREQRLKRLQDNNLGNVVAVYKYYQQNRSIFNRDVYCVPLEISVNDPQHADYIEMHCPAYLFRSFVCEDINDRNTLTEYSEKCGLNITVIYRPPTEYQPDHPCKISELKKYGITHFLDQTFDAPASVKSVLKETTQMDTVAVGGSNSQVELLLAQRIIKCVFIPGQQFLMKVSNYSGESSTRVVDVNRSRLFTAVDMTEKKTLEQEVSALMESKIKMEKEVNELLEAEQKSKKIALTIEAEKRELDRRKKERDSLQKTLHNYKKERENFDMSTLDFEEEERRATEKIKAERTKQIEMHIELKNHMKKATELMMAHDKYPLSLLSLKYDLEEVKVKYQDSERKTRELESQKKELDMQFNQVKLLLKSLKDDMDFAKKKYSEEHGKTEEEITAILLSLPEDEEILIAEIRENEDEADKILTNEGVVLEYEKRCKEIQDKEKELETFKTDVANMTSVMEELKSKWLAPLKECIQKINETFVEYCHHIGISGEICLTGDEDNFEKWEIEIKVKFRDNEKLTTLSAHRQSGGERSVTTILYLLSLQQLNKSPFRVVDEINQGMDPNNERKIFYQMLDSSQGEDIPQSFLITPKLLPNLVPNKANNITVLFIFNGPVNVSQEIVEKYFAGYDKGLDPSLKQANGSTTNGSSSAALSSDDESGSEEE